MNRIAPLMDWLAETESELLWTARTEKGVAPRIVVEGHAVNGRIIVVTRTTHPSGESWDILRPVSESSEITKTIDAAQQYVGSASESSPITQVKP